MDSETAPPTSELLEVLREHLADRYEVQRELGRGGMATVFLAEDLKHRRKVAVKVLLPDVAASIGQERFLREIEIAASLQHPHILPLYDSGAAGQYLYYVMPYVEGESLRDKLNREKQLPQEEVIRITQQVAAGLGHAHSLGVVHRDIKPENILLSSGTAVVADFGIARAASAAADKQSLTKTGTVVGTPYYMSPEQSTAQELDGRSDQYSLACVVYEMLIGEPPFTGPTPQAVMARHSMDMVSPPSIVRESIPETMEAALLRALAKQPVDRYPTIVMFADALATPSPITAAQRRRTGTGPVRASGGAAAGLRAFPWRRIALIGGPALLLAVAAVWLVPKLVRHGASNSSGPDPRHVAVLYFDDRTPDHSLGYLADGLTEALIHQLSQVGALSVISKNGVIPYRGTSVRIDSIGRALGVGSLVQGTVAAAGSQLRVEVSLVDPPTGRELDSKTIEAPKENLFALQDSLAGEVAIFLRQRVGEAVQLQQERTRTSDAAAWESLQRALSTANGVDVLLGAGDTAAARRLLDQADSEIQVAAKQDKNWARPHVERAKLDYRRFDLTGGFDRNYYDTWSAAGIAQADSALTRDPKNADALTLRGTLRYWRYALNLSPERGAAEKLLADAEADLRAAVSADSNQASAWAMLSSLLMRRSQTPEGKLAAQRAYEADPYLTEAASVLWRLYSSTLDLQNAVEARHWCDEGTRRFPSDPRFVECQLTLMALPGGTPDIPKAWRLLDQNVALYPPNQRDFRRRRGELFVAMALARAKLADSARHVADRARPQDASIDPTMELAYIGAMFRNMVGDRDEAIKQLALFLATNPAERSNLAKDDTWWWNGLRDDPKFKDLVGAK